ncbi:GMC family oxidoreductase [Mycobacterium paraffinicum]|uniref:GMC family oxidoreductase n=1 Tax=Mycobacterium paraffinicum TaxID=53378 RepID=UPI0009FE1AF7|nr:GMC family oxidoreductase [Mycobacterium paraffinicum]
MTSTSDERGFLAAVFADRVHRNQRRLAGRLKRQYDFIVCGSGSSGSVVARRLAENPGASVLVLEAGGCDDGPEIRNPEMWLANLGSERDWNFTAEPNCHLNGRAIPYAMGKVLGGGSSINVMVWARGHRNDWNYFASEAKDPQWSYDSVLAIYREIEDWHGAPDPEHRGTGGPVYVESATEPSPIAHAGLAAASSLGIPTFPSQNGELMEGGGGASLVDLRIRNGLRQSVFRSYLYPLMDRPNLTVLAGALVTRVTLDGGRATGVEFFHGGRLHRVEAKSEVVLSLGAIHTPKVLMQSGIGDQIELQSHGIRVVQHLPGVGRNLQDHPGFSCVWEYRDPLPWRNSGGEMTVFARSDASLRTPDLQAYQLEFPFCSDKNAERYGLPESGWSMYGAVVRPKSRGQIRLTGPDPNDPVRIHANLLSHPDDLSAAVACLELCRDLGNSGPLRRFSKREVMPGSLNKADLVRFIRNEATTYHHQTCTAKMGRDSMSVVDGSLKVYGVEGLRIADGSVMPRVTTGNTMAPCVIIGERAGQILRHEHGL